MGETEKQSVARKENWFTGLKAEFKKIIWPTKESLARQTTAVVVVSVVIGLIIAIADVLIQYGVNFLVNL
ncbi:MAG: preprotein translocase subunit SecE [Lachnospiraceae bacterium]|nr:preprotein translocase subunit SecE [Lachnospiraceae bacterium]